MNEVTTVSDRLFNRLPLSAQGLLRASAGLALMVLGSAALAQSAANGKILYDSTDTLCFVCHGRDPNGNFQSVKNGANNPGRILAACADPNVNRFGGMISFCGPGTKGEVSAAEAADLAAYIANPAAANEVPAISVSTQTLTFRRSIGGGQSGRQNVSVTNTGGGNLVLTAVALTGANPGDYKLLAPQAGAQCVNGTTIAAKASCSVDITFDPAVVGTRNAQLQISPDASSTLSPVSVALNGTATQAAEPFATADVSALNFGAQVLNTASGTKTVVVTNSGEANLTFDSAATAFALTGTNAAEFAVDPTGTCVAAGTVASGATCTILLKFTPTAAGNRTATLTVNSNGTDLVVELAGAGINADANEGAGGCSMVNPNAALDPTLLALCALALGVLGLRRRQQR
jgi:hypothetical protein